MKSMFKYYTLSERANVPTFFALNILKLLCSYYKKGSRNYQLEGPFVLKEEGYNIINKESEVFQFLSYELGVGEEYLWAKLNELIHSDYKICFDN